VEELRLVPLQEEAIEDVVDFVRVWVVRTGREGGVCREIEGGFSIVGKWRGKRRCGRVGKAAGFNHERHKDICAHAFGSV